MEITEMKAITSNMKFEVSTAECSDRGLLSVVKHVASHHRVTPQKTTI
jgi:hypothetical protein